jgi:hypothetical protein
VGSGRVLQETANPRIRKKKPSLSIKSDFQQVKNLEGGEKYPVLGIFYLN